MTTPLDGDGVPSTAPRPPRRQGGAEDARGGPGGTAPGAADRKATATVPAPQAPDASGPSAPARSGKPAKERDAFFDNAKYLAIVLVAIGHAWEPLRGDSRVIMAAYMAIYAFHMPAFILIAGYFSRNFDHRPDRIQRLITGVAVPYVLFQLIFTAFNRWIKEDPEIPVRMFNPWWITWFLMALFIWRLSAPLWRVIRWPLPVALGLAVIASASPYLGNNLDIQRVFQFLPFFVLGTQLHAHHFELVRHRLVRLSALPVLVVGGVISYWAVPRMNYQWFFHRDSAQELGAPWWTGAVMQLALFACALVLTVCFLALVPSRPVWFTVLGGGTLYGYLLHVFPAKGSIAWGWYDTGLTDGPLGAVLVTVVAITVMSLLCSPPVQRLCRPLVEPRLRWIFRRETQRSGR